VPNERLRILMGMVFYPRGGSAQVVRYLSRALLAEGHDVHLAVGSVDDGDPEHNAHHFYGELPATIVDYTAALEAHQRGADPISADLPTPFHPSYEDKPNVPDRVFYELGAKAASALQRCWQLAFERVRKTFEPSVLHLHHINHMHIAATESFPAIRRVAHLHGTELKMLERMRMLATGGDYADERVAWKERMHAAAQGMDHFIAISRDVLEKGSQLLDIDERKISLIPNGIDTDLFCPMAMSSSDKLDFLQQLLVAQPKGWDESGVVGSIRYTHVDLARLKTNEGRFKPLVIFVGRFLGFKRVPLLLEALAAVNERFAAREPPYNTIIWGGMPGEWEGEHPYTACKRLKLSNVFLTGWLPHDQLVKGLKLADVFVAPSHFEPFGQVFLEAMATGIPVIGTRSGGPLEFVRDHGKDANGWLAEVDDVTSLADQLYAALSDRDLREQRGVAAKTLVLQHYSWSSLAHRFLEVYRR